MKNLIEQRGHEDKRKGMRKVYSCPLVLFAK